MIFVTEHGLAGPFELFAHLGFVIIVEPMALVAEPDAYRDRKAKSVCGVEPLVDAICAPCPHRVCARRRQLLERALAASATDEIRLTAAKELPTLVRLAELHRNGLCRGGRGPQSQAGG